MYSQGQTYTRETESFLNDSKKIETSLRRDSDLLDLHVI